MEAKKDYREGYLYFAIINASLGALTWGYDISVINAVSSFLQNVVFPGDSDIALALVGSIVTIGAAFGSFFSGRLVAWIGRRNSLILSDLISLIGSILTMITSLPVIIIGRAMIGLAIGINSVAIPLYNV